MTLNEMETMLLEKIEAIDLYHEQQSTSALSAIAQAVVALNGIALNRKAIEYETNRNKNSSDNTGGR